MRLIPLLFLLSACGIQEARVRSQNDFAVCYLASGGASGKIAETARAERTARNLICTAEEIRLGQQEVLAQEGRRAAAAAAAQRKPTTCTTAGVVTTCN